MLRFSDADLPSNWSDWLTTFPPHTLEQLSVWVKSRRDDPAAPHISEWPGWSTQTINPFAIALTLSALRRQEELAAHASAIDAQGAHARDHTDLIDVQTTISEHMHETSLIYAAAIYYGRFAADMTLTLVLGAILTAHRQKDRSLHEEALYQLTRQHFRAVPARTGKIVPLTASPGRPHTPA